LPRFDQILIVDWSAAGTPCRGANSIWIGSDRAAAINPETRKRAWKMLRCRLSLAQKTGQRVLIGVDFAFGYPSGVSRRVTGQETALAMWDHLSALHQDDDRNGSNYRDIAAQMNRQLGRAVFWGNGRKQQIADLPRLKPPPHDLPHHRVTENAITGARPKSAFQLAGAGCVGAQSLTGIPWLAHLRDRPGARVWPFEDWSDADVVLAEVYPSIIGAQLRDAAGFTCTDQAQVTVLAHALRRLDDADALLPLFTPDPRITDLMAEGQILGTGHEAALQNAATQVLAGRCGGTPDDQLGL
jgi:hypothetical protein